MLGTEEDENNWRGNETICCVAMSRVNTKLHIRTTHAIHNCRKMETLSGEWEKYRQPGKDREESNKICVSKNIKWYLPL